MTVKKMAGIPKKWSLNIEAMARLMRGYTERMGHHGMVIPP